MGIARVGDTDSDGNVITTGSPDVFVNGMPAARVGDIDNHHPDTIVTGSGTVFINGQQAASGGAVDSDHPDTINTSSPDVFCG